MCGSSSHLWDSQHQGFFATRTRPISAFRELFPFFVLSPFDAETVPRAVVKRLPQMVRPQSKRVRRACVLDESMEKLAKLCAFIWRPQFGIGKEQPLGLDQTFRHILGARFPFQAH